ncbi:MAG: tetratricopeptide repeat protein, partial [Lachnospiraceae bacterium]|nr:tetratricopeptide repeat protein [Lachnospiraceae bacterium]
FPENIVDTAEFHYGLACLYDSAGRFEETRREIAIGRELLERDKKPSDEEDEKYNRHRAIFLLLEANTVLQSPEREFDQAMELVSEAQKLIPDIGVSMKIRILRQRREEGDAEQIVEECEKILRDDPSDLNALKYMQEAYEMQGMAQEVVDLYERIRNIYAQDSEIYERAARAFAAYGMYADVMNVISEAEESGALNWNLRMRKYYAAGMMSQSNEEWQAAVREAGVVIGELAKQEEQEDDSGDSGHADTLSERDADRETLGCAYLYRAMLYRDPKLVKENPPIANLLDEELSDLERCLEYCDYNDAHYRIGQVYSDKEDQEQDVDVRSTWADKAYEHLSIAARRGRRNPWLYAVLADYSENRDEYQDAVRYMTGALEMVGEDDDWTRRQYKRLVFWCRCLYEDTLLEDYAQQALQYADISDEKYGETIEVHMDRGRIYNRQGRRPEAVREWTRALELLEEAEDTLYHTKQKGWAYNGMGNAYRYMHDYEKAIEAYDRARSILDAPEFCGESYAEYPYEAISICYLYGGRGYEGLAYYKKCLEETTKSDSHRTERVMELILEALIDLSCFVGDYDGAIPYIKQRYGSIDLTKPAQEPWNWEKEADRMNDILWYQFRFPEAFSDRIGDRCRTAMEVVKREGAPAASSDRETLSGYADYLENLAESMIILGMDDAAARNYLEEALTVHRQLQDDSKCYNLYEQLMWACRFMGDHEQAEIYAEKCIRAWETETEPCQALHISLEEAIQRGWIYAKASMFYMGQYYIGKGDLEKAKECVEKMDICPLCTNCEHTVCFEYLALQAAIAYFEGDMERTREFCDATEEVPWSQHFSLTTLLRNRMKKRTVN